MLLKLAALGAIGYVGYKYLEKNGGLAKLTGSSSRPAGSGGAETDLVDPHLAVAGGPLSNEARVVHSGEPLGVA